MKLETKKEQVLARRTELEVMREFCTGDCRYLIDYYGAMIDTVSADSSRLNILLFLFFQSMKVNY